MKTVSQWWVLVMLWITVGCTTTEPVVVAPSINLSPEEVNLGPEQQRPDFGLSLSVNESDSLENLEALPGVRVTRVNAGSVADRAGVQAGDVILSVNNTETNYPDSLQDILATQSGPWIIEARRGTTVYETQLTQPRTEQSYTPKERYRVDPLRTRAGYLTNTLQRDSTAVTVATIAALNVDSPLMALGLVEGDHILALDDQAVESAQGLVTRLTSEYAFGQAIELTVLRAGGETQTPDTITTELWAPPRRLTGLQLWPLFTYRASAAGDRSEFTLLDFFVVSLFDYQRRNGEKHYRFFTLLKYSTGYGELSEDTGYE